ncbi:hypothetical protein, partial [Proteus faecis]|uniref:hypothetical protein n=1 Tax=Proteus faecis TaxID=2050967 RepID=UPI00301C2AE2
AMYDQDYTAGSPSEQITQKFATIIPFDETSQKQLVTQLEQIHSIEEKIAFLNGLADDVYKQREKQMGEELMRQVEKFVLLSV